MRKIFIYALQAVLVSLMIVSVSCSDEKDEANSSSTENTSNTSGTYNLSKGDAQMVDLGLPSGTKWADRNIGATSPEDYGAYFAWGEISPKDNYDWSTYLDGGIASGDDCGTDKDPMKGITDIACNATYDAATVNWGAGYKMPTVTQWEELNNSSYTTWTWCDGEDTKYNNTTVAGYLVTSKTNGNSIFLPAAGGRLGTDHVYAGSYGYYWSSSLGEGDPRYAVYVYFYSSYHDVSYYGRYYGLSVRAVSE